MSIYDFAEDVRGDGRRRRLLVDEDFSWSEPPRKRRGGSTVAERPGRTARPAERSRRSEEFDALPEPAAAHVDQSLYDGPVGGRAVEVHDLRGARGPHTELALLDRGTVGEAQLEALDADHVYLDQRSGGLALTAEGRRTIVITGHGAERNLPARPRREASLRVYERTGFRPDRIALWAFLLALALLLGATTSSHAATLVQHLPH